MNFGTPIKANPIKPSNPVPPTDPKPSTSGLSAPSSTYLQTDQRSGAAVRPLATGTTQDADLKRKQPALARSSITVNERQRGNPLLKSIQVNSYHFDKIVPDYLLGSKSCALFLSLKYHNMYPQYVYDRMNAVGSNYALKVLLVLVDVLDSNHSLKEMTQICSLSDFVLMCAWSYEDAGRILDTYKCFEHKSPESIMDKKIVNKTSHYQCNLDALASIRTINKTDALSLISTFGTLENIVKSSKMQLNVCPGLGGTKAEALTKFFSKPFKRKG